MMNKINDHDSMGESGSESPREETLISRIVDGEAFEDDWREFERGAQSDSRAWERLARAQREHDRLARNVEDAIAIAELVDLPQASVHAFALSARIRQYSGWAVAAALSLALLTVMGIQVGSSGMGASTAGIDLEKALAEAPAEKLYESYVARGRESGLVVGEPPNIVMEVENVATGSGYHVVFVRQIIERRTVSDLQMVQEEFDPDTGRPTYAPMPPLQRVAGRAY